MQRERSRSTSSNKLDRNISTKTNSTAQVSDVSIKNDSDVSEDQIGGDDMEPAKCPRNFINISKNNSISSRSCCGDHLLHCLSFWQDNVYPNGYKA